MIIIFHSIFVHPNYGIAMNEEDIFIAKKIRCTAVRLLVWKEMHHFDYAFSLSDLEERLYTIDKSSLFRTIMLFKEKEMLHEIDDGSGSVKYCICDCTDETSHQHHVHISCTHCKKTYCIKTLSVPFVNLPKDFEVDEICYIVKGTCAKCRKKR